MSRKCSKPPFPSCHSMAAIVGSSSRFVFLGHLCPMSMIVQVVRYFTLPSGTRQWLDTIFFRNFFLHSIVFCLFIWWLPPLQHIPKCRKEEENNFHKTDKRESQTKTKHPADVCDQSCNRHHLCKNLRGVGESGKVKVKVDDRNYSS